MTQFDTIFAALQTTGVRYVVVGGVEANRPQDLLDVEQLEKIRRLLNERGDASP